MTSDRMSWQLGDLSANVRAGDYFAIRPPSGTNWRTRVIIPMQHGIVAVRIGNAWVMPGGGLEEGETLPECAIREVWEETHLAIAIKRLIYVREFPDQAKVQFYILATHLSGELAIGHDPEPDREPITDVKILSFNAIEEDRSMIFYPQTIRRQLRHDLTIPPATALYIGAAP